MNVFELPSTWIWIEIDKISEIVGGGTPSRNNSDYFDGDILWATPTDVTALDNLWIEKTKEKITQTGLKNSSAKLLPCGTVLMTSRATIGATAIAHYPMATNQGFANFICNENLLYNEYLAYWLPSIKPYLLNLAGGTTFKEIAKSALKKIKIPLPPLLEQRRIVSILREADEIRCLRKQANEKRKKFLQSVFFELFGNPDPKRNNRGWEIVKLEDFLEVGTGGTPSRSNPSYYGGSYAWVKTTELRDNIINSTEETITDTGLKFSNAKIYPENTILLAMYGQGQTRGRTAKLGIPAATNQACAAFLPSNELLPNYLWYWFQNSYKNIRDLARGGPQVNLNLSILKNLKIPKPDLNLQQRFESLVDEYLQLEALSTTSLDKTDSLFKSLLSNAFTGELTAAWRDQHQAQLTVAECDQLLQISQPVDTEELADEEASETKTSELHRDRDELLRSLSKSQWKIYELVIQETAYFTPEHLEEKYSIPRNIGHKSLQLLAAAGLIIPVTLPTPTSSGLHYESAYRNLNQDDDTRYSDDALLEKDAV
ncbi:hypothetical protein GS682_22910 [Nostoc sp. B(2019)]|nr:hypothetical protein [Nostoc sp. B(2019)]